MDAASIIAIITALTALVAAVGAVFVNLRTMSRDLSAVKTDVGAVHKMVNQQKTDADAYQALLVQALEIAGVEVPRDESLDTSRTAIDDVITENMVTTTTTTTTTQG